MLTPIFKLSQDENHVFITVHAPYTNIGETEIDVDGENFLFVSSPYFLRLRLPGRIVENDRSKGSYVCDSGDFNLTFDKENPGEHFEHLDMITSLLAPRDIPNVNPELVEMLEEGGITIQEDEDENSEFNKYTYGFANKLTTEFSDVGREFPQIFEMRAPERVDVEERHVQRMEYENHKFSNDHYLADYYDEELIAPYLACVAPWTAPDFDPDKAFTEAEVAVLKELPNKHYILTKREFNQVMLSLVDILYGYCYEKRSSLNDISVESSWTINKLSSTLSWFCSFNSMKEVLVACFRRALTFPIFRNFDLCIKVKGDIEQLLNAGKKSVIKVMIEIHNMFNTSNDARYILNQLYIKDYLVFLQKCTDEDYRNLLRDMIETDISKGDLLLEIEELEAAAALVKKEDMEIMENKMALKMARMSLIPGLNKNAIHLDSDDDISSSSSSSTDSSSDSDSDWSDIPSDEDPS